MIPDEQTQRPWRSPVRLLLLSILIGGASGLGAVGFRALIGLLHNLFFSGRLSWLYDANLHAPPSPFGAWIILVPVAGSLAVTFLVERFAPEAKGHGVPEVIDAIYYQDGKIRPRVAVVKSLASALSIGSGGSVGREGPIIQIGSAISSYVGEKFKLTTWERITLIAAGAAGGIAATFNTPLGGVLFAVEIVVHEVSVRTLVPVALATAVATYVGRLFFGPRPSFVIPDLAAFSTTVTNPALVPLRRAGRADRAGVHRLHPVDLRRRGPVPALGLTTPTSATPSACSASACACTVGCARPDTTPSPGSATR